MLLEVRCSPVIETMGIYQKLIPSGYLEIDTSPKLKLAKTRSSDIETHREEVIERLPYSK